MPANPPIRVSHVIGQQPSSNHFSTMKISQDVACSNTAMEATRTTDQNLNASELSPLLQLPLELRRQIYRLSLLDSREPAVETLYLKRRSDGSKDPPSPLPLANSQVRAEVVDMVQIYPIILRVTHQGILFDSLRVPDSGIRNSAILGKMILGCPSSCQENTK